MSIDETPRRIGAITALELGWLAMEAGDEDVALLAFEPLTKIDAHGTTGRRAALLKGYVMLSRKSYDRATRHYEQVARRYASMLEQFEHDVSRVRDFADLARDCEVRTWALANPRLVPVLERAEIDRARKVEDRIDRAVKRGIALKRQVSTAEAMLAGKAPSPLRNLQEARARAAEALRTVDSLTLDAESASLRRRWRAQLGPAPPDPGCCEEPRERLKKIRTVLERIVTHLDTQTEAVRNTLTQIRDDLRRASEQHDAQLAANRPTLRSEQRRLVVAAVEEARRELRNMIVEGDAGALEAIWRYKEDHRDQIKRLELERKERIRSFEKRFDDATMELEDLYRD